MSILSVENLNHGYGGREILRDVNFKINKGEHIGFVGANGEGKSSLMNIITNKFESDEGTIEWAKAVRIGYLDQHSAIDENMTIRDVLTSAFFYLNEMEERMQDLYMKMADMDEDEMNSALEEVGTIQDLLEHNDFYLIDSKVDEISRAFDISSYGMDTMAHSLSGGQRSKLLLCKLLLQKPDILMLDEPTNYLDEVHINWLRKYLQEYENAFFLISHDIEFLNSVVNIIYHIENCELNRYVGDYDEFKRVYEIKKNQIEAEYKRQQQEIAKLEDFVARNKARVSTRNMAMSRQKKLDKMDRIELMREKPKPEFNFKEYSSTGKVIFRTNDLVVGYTRPLCKPLNLIMQRGDRIAISGANGLGKTTLLKTILGMIEPLSGSVELGENLHLGYFSQESEANRMNTAIEDLWQYFPSYTQAEIRAALAKCGLTNQHIESKVAVLSGGEQAKLRLARIINEQTNVLLLDEPTNHIDVDAKEELKRALKEYSGAIFIISHEKEFYMDIATQVWKMEDFI